MIKRINIKPFRDFFQSGSAGGILLMVCLAVSLLIANSALADNFDAFLAQEIGFSSAAIQLRYPVIIWINDGLMAVFFLLVGLEIKRELVEGELSSFKKASLPAFAAVGGMLLPALIYAALNSGTQTAGGWGIPMATDIAFAIAVLSLLSNKIPVSLKVFLIALAIVDDLGAIVVIALFYSKELHLNYLLYAAAVFSLQIAFNLAGVKKIVFYLIPGAVMWYLIHHSGVHATIAGVLTALTLPTTPGADESPLEKLEHALTKPVNFMVMPVFALANTNISLQGDFSSLLTSPLSLGIMLGLLVGKPLGITFMAWLSVKTGISSLPKGVSWFQVLGAGILAGIGFTMSIFITLLSFQAEEIQTGAKISILAASLTAGILGFLVLKSSAKRKAAHQGNKH